MTIEELQNCDYEDATAIAELGRRVINLDFRIGEHNCSYGDELGRLHTEERDMYYLPTNMKKFSKQE